MSFQHWLRGAAIAILAAGCDERSIRNSPATQQAGPAATRETTPASGPTSQQAFSQLNIDDEPTAFAPARVQLSNKDGAVQASLYSDDPIENDYAGNSYFFDMTFDADDLSDGSAEWRYKAPTTEPVDSPRGIFLEGMKKHLQPLDVVVRVEGRGSPLTVRVEGQFMEVKLPERPETPSRVVTVTGTLSATVHTEKE